jgi:hypothetical protein
MPMKEVQTKRIAMVMVSLMLIAAFFLPIGMVTNVAQAAAKPAISATMKIGTGSIVGDFDYYSKTDGRYVLSVSNVVKNATYSFVSSNTKILTVKASGSKVYLTGVKAGTAIITCNQKLSGKTTKVGTCKVTVVNSTINQDFVPELPLGTGYTEVVEFSYRNNDAVYTYVSDNKNFSMNEKNSTFDGMQFIHQTYTAKAVGTYTVTVKETYNKITRVVGKIKYVVKKATVVPTETVDLGLDVDAYGLVRNYRTDVSYLFETEDDGIVNIYKEDTVYLIGKKAGTTKINIYEDAKTPDKSKLLGTCTIIVKEAVLKNIDFYFDETEAYAGEDPISVEVEKDPYYAPGVITVTSSDPAVATVSSIDEEGNFEVTPVSEGSTKITISCGDLTKTETFTVYSNEDSEEDSDEY